MLYAYAFYKKSIKTNDIKGNKKIKIFLYIIIFIMGTVFGSFYTLAVYRIPKKIDIIKTHSYCPNCNHKLGFFELIPVFSYLFLGGKCKKCKQKIRPRYVILEILSGLAFVLIAYGLKIDVYNLDINSLIRFGFICLYLVSIFIIAGIDKEHRKIEQSVLYYGITVSCFYIIYLCIIDEYSIYRYVMYLITLIILLILENRNQVENASSSYLLELFILIIVMAINTGFFVTLGCIFGVISAIVLAKIIYSIGNNLNKYRKENKNIFKLYKIGYLLSITNILLFIISLNLK